MITYFKMKKNEWKVKMMFYSTIATIMIENKEILNLFQRMFIALKDVPADELQKEFVSKLAEFIHEGNKH